MNSAIVKNNTRCAQYYFWANDPESTALIRLIRNMTGKDMEMPYLPNPFVQVHEGFCFGVMGAVILGSLAGIGFIIANSYKYGIK